MGSKRKEVEISGVDVQQDGERLTNALIHEFIGTKTTASSATHIPVWR